MEIAIGHELELCTRNISVIKISDRERSDHDIVFIDTPGFDTLNVSEADILKLVSDWLKTTWVYPIKSNSADVTLSLQIQNESPAQRAALLPSNI